MRGDFFQTPSQRPTGASQALQPLRSAVVCHTGMCVYKRLHMTSAYTRVRVYITRVCKCTYICTRCVYTRASRAFGVTVASISRLAMTTASEGRPLACPFSNRIQLYWQNGSVRVYCDTTVAKDQASPCGVQGGGGSGGSKGRSF